MATTMVRKQISIGREQERKLKALAASRGWTEAAVIRDALDRLPEPEGGVVERLAAAGLLAPKRQSPDVPTGAALAALEAEVDAWLARLPRPIGLSEAVLAERDER